MATQEHVLVNTTRLHVPSKEELCRVFDKALSENYREVSCKVTQCPDLREFGFKCKGFGGQPDILDCGTIMHSMFNPDKQHDVFTMPQALRAIGKPSGFLIGAGAGSVDELGVNSELAINAFVDRDGKVDNGSYASFISNMATLPEAYAVRKTGPRGEFGCIGNLMRSDGTPSEVIEIRARVRRTEKNWSDDPHDQEFIRILRTALAKRWPDAKEQVACGGAMLVRKGKTVTHIMPPYFPPRGAKPGKSWPDMKGWSERFFIVDREINGCTVFMNHQGPAKLPNGLSWRLDHTHYFSKDGTEAGHYHYDVDPEVIEYVAFVVPAESIHKIELSPKARL